MTRDDVLAEYRPLRASIQRVLSVAPDTLTDADWRRATDLLAVNLDDDVEIRGVAEMLADLALFEPNASGRRPYDRFMKKASRRIDTADLPIAKALQSAFFSIFRVAERHEAAGLWLEDLADGARRIWVMDEGLEASASDGICFAARLFDAGPFHAGLGIVVTLDAERLAAHLSAENADCRPGGAWFAPLIYSECLLDALVKRELSGLDPEALIQLQRSLRNYLEEIEPPLRRLA